MGLTMDVVQLDQKAVNRFWSKVNTRANGCWEWRAACTPNGYGQFWLGKKQYGAHRIAWLIARGTILPGLMVCHICDNPRCVRPEHLFLGTAKDNVADMWKKGHGAAGERNGTHTHPERVERGNKHSSRRRRECRPRGERHYRAKLTQADVVEIRSLSRDYSSAELGQRFGVHKSTIKDILHYRTWVDYPARS